MEKRVQLPNKFGYKNYLEFWYKGRTSEHILWYKLELENHKQCLIAQAYKRRRRECRFIEPVGGPKIDIGAFRIENMLLHKILVKKGKGFVLGFVEDK